MSHTVVGVFDTTAEAQTAVQQLVSTGFDRDYIDVSSPSSSGTAGYNTTDNTDDDSIGSFFRSLFGNDDERSTRYAGYARKGVIVTVHAQSAMEAERAANILDEYGAVDLDERATGYSTGTMNTTDTSVADTTTSGTSIPVIEEELQVGKREVETGGVRVRSRVFERPVEEHLRLREERVYVERTPVNRPATDAELSGLKDQDIELTEHAEVPMVDKQARVVEEVRVGKDVEEHVENIHDTVRKTDVEVDDIGPDNSSYGSTDPDLDRPHVL